MKYPTEMDVIKVIAVIFLFIACLMLLPGCATLGSGTRGLKRVEVKETHIVIPATAESPAQVVPVTEVTHITEDETTEESRHTSPDYDQIRPIAQVVGTAAGGTGLGSILGAGAALAVSTATAWFARGPAIKAARDVAEYHRRDAEEGYAKAEQAQRRAEEYALQLPPKT